MEYRKLGHTEIDVSVICLGTMTWGEQNTEAEAHQQLDLAMDCGINFIDTAEIYPVPPKAETCGLTEQYIGTWLHKRQVRDKVILASKVASRANWLSHIRDGNSCLNRKNIETALNASLKRLKTDYIDLYQLHWPDRNTNYFGKLGFEYDADENPIAIEETLKALDDLIKSGKVRHFGLSNETPWGAMSFINLAEQKPLPLVVSIQNPYNLLNRSYEIGMAEISQRENIGLLAYSPLGFGALSGKYLCNARPEGARLTLFEYFNRYSNGNAIRATELYVNIAKQHNLDPAQMALAYVNSKPFLTSNIIGATNAAQLKSNIASTEIKLSESILSQIEAVHEAIPNPSP
ncbi:MAG: NADP(H)-dependent aldo-keto reductase [Gammaproteobacteria bacterium]|nr:NADP(H)-dependent aldo-keto reductase [Gammaproteobacteria bacterium]